MQVKSQDIHSFNAADLFRIACVAGARKGKGEGKIDWARAKRVGRGRRKRLQPAHCLFGLASSLICKR